MTMRRPWALLLGFVLAAGGPVGCAATAASLAPSAPVEWHAAASPVTSFRRDAQGRIILDGAVGGRAATVHLDSGSVGTVVSKALIDPATASRVDTAILNDQAVVERWRSVRIDLGPLSIEPNLVVVADRTGRADVLIGNAVFEEAAVEIDYEAKLVTFQPPAQFVPPAGATPLPLSRDGARVTGQVSLNGAPPICVGIDLGFNGSLSLAPSVIVSHGLKPDPAIEIIHETMGREPVRVPGLQRIERVTLAGFDVANVSASPGGYNDGPCGSLLGTELLSGFHLYFDLPHDTLWLAPRADLEPRFETAVGITYRNTRGGLLVTAISQASPARGLVEIGERIARIEDAPVRFVMPNGEVRMPLASVSREADPLPPAQTSEE